VIGLVIQKNCAHAITDVACVSVHKVNDGVSFGYIGHFM